MPMLYHVKEQRIRLHDTQLGCRVFIYEQLGHAVYEEAKDFNRRMYDFLME